ncbi:MAG: hypothetical protein HRU10_09260 [Opitutales bacterium]|nr:hypothetical protein [Opitutales bacterium]
MNTLRIISIAFLLSVLAGCAPGGYNASTNWKEASIINTLEYPVAVKVAQIDAQTYEVEAGEARFIAATGVNQPLEQLERYEAAARIELKNRLGPNIVITRISYQQPDGWAKAFFRFRVEFPDQ